MNTRCFKEFEETESFRGLQYDSEFCQSNNTKILIEGVLTPGGVGIDT